MRHHLFRIFKDVKYKLRYPLRNQTVVMRDRALFPRKNVQLKTIDGADARAVFARAKGPFVFFLRYLYRCIYVFSGASFYSSARGSQEPRLEAHPGYGATEIRNQEIRSRVSAQSSALVLVRLSRVL